VSASPVLHKLRSVAFQITHNLEDEMFKSKKTAWLTIVALLVPTTAGLFGSSAAQAADVPATLSTFTVNGTDVLTSNSLSVDVSTLNVSETGVLSADVVATATNTANTTVTITGDSGLAVGPNTLSVSVVASWTEQVQNPNYVPARTEANPAYVAEVQDDPETTEVNEYAPAQGEPTITYPAQGTEYTTESRTASQTYTRTINVLNNDTSAVITVNAEELVNGDGTEVDWGVTSVPVVVVPTDSNATVKINGTSVALVSGVATRAVTGLETGDNSITVAVTAPNGEVDESVLTVTVLPNTDTSAVITVDGIMADDGDSVPLDYGTTDPDIAVETADVDATYVVEGGSDLITGDNGVVIWVTAADGVTFQRYDLNLVVAPNDDTTATVYINGVAYDEGSDITLPYQTSSVTVRVELGDLEASYVVEGGTELVQGGNDLAVTVTAGDQTTTYLYGFNLVVSDPDVTLKTIKVNGTSVVDGGTTTSWALNNTLLLETTDPRATVAVDGGIYNATTGVVTLEPGQNDLTITVTGDDRATTRDYAITVGVYALDVTWEGAADSVSATPGSTINVPGSVEAVEVTATSALTGWIAEVEVTNDLNFGNNTVYVTFTSEENVETVVSFTVFVGPADLSLSTFTVNGDDVTLTGLTGRVELEGGTLAAEVEIETADARSEFVINAPAALHTGHNALEVVVTGADGRTATYTVDVYVLPSDNTEIAAISINGHLLAEDAEITEISAGTISVEVDTAFDAATVEVTVAPTTGTFGGWATTTNGVVTGSGYLTASIVVTAEDGTKGDAVLVNLIATKDFDVTSGSNPATDTLRVGTYAKSTPATVAALFPAGAKVTYQWLADGEVVAGANTSRLLLAAEDLERELRPVVSATVAGVKKVYVGEALVVTKGIIALASVPGVNGKAQIGSTLTAVPKKWTKDVELNYQWYVNGVAFDGATTETFSLSEDNVNQGEVVKVRVTGTLDGYDDLFKESASFTVTPGVLKITEKPTISAEDGYVTGSKISVEGGEVNYANADVDYQWFRNGVAIAGETDADYTTVAADVSKKLSVTVSFSAFNYSSVSITLKSATIKVGTLDAPDAANIGINMTGTKLIAFGGYVDTATTSSIKYIWYRNGRAVLGQNSAQYTLTSKDAGAVITVRVTAIYPGYMGTTTVTTGVDAYHVEN